MYCIPKFMKKPMYYVKDKDGKLIVATKNINTAISAFYALPKNGRTIIMDPGFINVQHNGKQR